MPRLVLGSASPRRAALLRELGAEFTVRASNAPEIAAPGESAAEFARRAAREKGAAVAQESDGAWVLSADTVVVLDGVALGKPSDAADARRMLQRLSGREHEVLTAVALTAPAGTPAAELLVRSAVAFRTLSPADIDAYVATGEPLDKAGAYGIQGGAAAFVAHVGGSYTNVVGLPIDEVRDLLARFGILHGEAREDAPSPRS
jgi:nucleoside triphosphate pyrophosphatase